MSFDGLRMREMIEKPQCVAPLQHGLQQYDFRLRDIFAIGFGLAGRKYLL
jgi:hypothetical protein